MYIISTTFSTTLEEMYNTGVTSETFSIENTAINLKTLIITLKLKILAAILTNLFTTCVKGKED